ncbi:MAG: 50S ribosomal protein L7ae-like protein [Clostridium sp.]|nr:50S ribosomal protein L7ae-like protein [Clostridium sp.]
MLGNLKGNKKTVGLKQSMKAIEKMAAKEILIAKDADERVVGRIKDACTKNNIPIVYVDTMKQLGKACDIEVGAAVVCLLRD